MSTINSSNNRNPIGIVLQDKAAGSREILVNPQDTLLAVGDNELKPIANTVKVTAGGSSNSVGEVTETNVIRAQYWGNELTDIPPDVVKGEEVELIFDNDTGIIYWKSSGRTSKNRSRERTEFRAANQEGYSKNIDDSNSYFIRIDTLTTKEIRIQTCTSDGEEFGYVVLINPKDSKIRISDSANNEIGIDSKDTKVFMRNKDNTIVSLDKENLLLGAPDTIMIKADKQIVLNTPNLTSVNDGGDGCMVWKAKSVEFDVKEQYVVKAPDGVGLHGPVEASSIVAGPVQAENYCTDKY